MSRDRSHTGALMSPTQRRAVVVVVCCIAAVILSFLLSWVLLPGLLGDKTVYDPTLYPIDTTQDAVLPQGAESSDYMNGTVLVGDQYTVGLQSLGLVTLDQVAGAQNLSLSAFLQQTCVYFADDPNSYTIVQGLAKMKPRRVVLTLGSNDVTGNYSDVNAFITDYRQIISAITQAYSYCDIIVNAIPPVRQGSSNAASRQTRIDEYNQALAAMCQSDGHKFLNSSEMLKADNGFAEDSYFDSGAGTFTAAGGNALLLYLRQHPYLSTDRRPDTNDIPLRAAQPGGAQTGAEPSATPEGITVTYVVEDPTRGSLSTTTTTGLTPGSSPSGASKLEFTVPSGSGITVKAEPKEGWCFLRWDDTQTFAERTDTVTESKTYVAVFAKPSVEILLNNSHCDDMQDLSNIIKIGESYPFTARVFMDGSAYNDGTNAVQWVVNDNIVTTGASYTFKPTEAGNYTILAGVEINGVKVAVSVSATVNAPATPPPVTTISITGSTGVKAGETVKLDAAVTNGVGDTSWRVDNHPEWSATGSHFEFRPTEAGTYTVHAVNNNTEKTWTVTVTGEDD